MILYSSVSLPILACSLVQNKPNGQFHLSHTSEAIKDFMQGLSIRKIPGIGRVSERLLDSIGVKVRCFYYRTSSFVRSTHVQTCGDIYKSRGVLSLLDKQFGLHSMLRIYLGITSNVVQPWVREEKKSIGSERSPSPMRMMAFSNVQLEHSGPFRRKRKSCRNSRTSRPNSKTTWKGEDGWVGLSR
jgi:nucleotidyltransferase/DNA polymerase involved in DNA repair